MTEDRAVSITVTHVMTVGITTILIAGLFIGAGNMLQDQTQRSGDREIRSVGDRHATEIVTASVRGIENSGDVDVRSRQPATAVGGSYTVALTNSSACFERDYYDGCLALESAGSDISAEVPISTPEDVVVFNGTAQGGSVVVEYEHDTGPAEGVVTIRGEDS